MNSDIGGDPIVLQGFAPKDLYQKREKIFTRYVGGKFAKLRYYTGWPLLLGYFLTPWLTWNDQHLIMLDIAARQFHVLGLTIWPQDLWLLGWLLMIAAVGLFAVTTVVGRLWCGYTCPQTVWTAIFMWAEQVAEGSRHQRMRLDAAPWGWDKLGRRSIKHLMWLGWATLTGLSFVGYFTPIETLAWQLLIIDTASLNTWTVFWVAFFTLATYVNAGWLREQVCLYMCPYARFQSAMIDDETLIVSYDPKRGDPRGSRKRNQPTELGDCIDCQLCVQVCPTGIDIRAGLQYECIGCAHCIDACAEVMKKMSYAPNLISYTTERELHGNASHWLRPRSVGYAAVCAGLSIALIVAVALRSPLAVDILRNRGALYTVSNSGEVHNNYQLKVMNKSQATAHYTISVASPDWIQITTTKAAIVESGEVQNLPLTLQANLLNANNTSAVLRICRAGEQVCVTEATPFLIPAKTNEPSTSTQAVSRS